MGRTAFRALRASCDRALDELVETPQVRIVLPSMSAGRSRGASLQISRLL